MFNKSKKSQSIQRNGKAWSIQRKKNKPPETAPEKHPMAEILDKDFKITVFTMLTELKECVGKVKKIMYKQNKNINKQKTSKKPKRNSGDEKCNY